MGVLYPCGFTWPAPTSHSGQGTEWLSLTSEDHRPISTRQWRLVVLGSDLLLMVMVSKVSRVVSPVSTVPPTLVSMSSSHSAYRSKQNVCRGHECSSGGHQGTAWTWALLQHACLEFWSKWKKKTNKQTNNQTNNV